MVSWVSTVFMGGPDALDSLGSPHMNEVSDEVNDSLKILSITTKKKFWKIYFH